jgi:hypothetical protein
METEIFTLCDFAQDNQSKLTIVGTFDSIQSAQFPVTHAACSIACRLRFGVKETGDHDFKIQLTDNTGKDMIQPVTGVITVRPPVNGHFAAANIVLNFNQLQFEQPGRYSFSLMMDGQWVTGLPLFLTRL